MTRPAERWDSVTLKAALTSAGFVVQQQFANAGAIGGRALEHVVPGLPGAMAGWVAGIGGTAAGAIAYKAVTAYRDTAERTPQLPVLVRPPRTPSQHRTRHAPEPGRLKVGFGTIASAVGEHADATPAVPPQVAWLLRTLATTVGERLTSSGTEAQEERTRSAEIAQTVSSRRESQQLGSDDAVHRHRSSVQARLTERTAELRRTVDASRPPVASRQRRRPPPMRSVAAVRDRIEQLGTVQEPVRQRRSMGSARARAERQAGRDAGGPTLER